MGQKTLTIKEAAERLGVTRQRVHQLIKEGRLPAQKVSPHRYIVGEGDLELLKPGTLGGLPTVESADPWEGCSLKEEVMRFEADLIKRALETAQGRVTHAARLLGLTHQGLASILHGRHKNLLSARTPVLKRRRSLTGTSRQKLS